MLKGLSGKGKIVLFRSLMLALGDHFFSLKKRQ